MCRLVMTVSLQKSKVLHTKLEKSKSKNYLFGSTLQTYYILPTLRIMPRPGDGSSHNAPFEEYGHDIVHGAGSAETSKVPRAEKTADLPEGLKEQGAGIKGMNASGGQSQGLKKSGEGGEVGQGGRHI
ncbi:hypothetical protein J3459_010989 [Metarhizium acridum]|nr:hypothetical protein J3459_010989 [Metarhizium acridum]